MEIEDQSKEASRLINEGNEKRNRSAWKREGQREVGKNQCWRSIRLRDKADGRHGLSGVESSARKSRGARIRNDSVFDDEKKKDSDSMYDGSRGMRDAKCQSG
jgi:hypothetical protein